MKNDYIEIGLASALCAALGMSFALTMGWSWQLCCTVCAGGSLVFYKPKATMECVKFGVQCAREGVVQSGVKATLHYICVAILAFLTWLMNIVCVVFAMFSGLFLSALLYAICSMPFVDMVLATLLAMIITGMILVLPVAGFIAFIMLASASGVQKEYHWTFPCLTTFCPSTEMLPSIENEIEMFEWNKAPEVFLNILNYLLNVQVKIVATWILFTVDIALLLVVGLAITKRLAIMTGGSLGILCGFSFMSYVSVPSPLVWCSIGIAAIVGGMCGVLMHILREELLSIRIDIEEKKHITQGG